VIGSSAALRVDFHSYAGGPSSDGLAQSVGELLRHMDEHSIARAVIAPLDDFAPRQDRAHELLIEAIAGSRDRFLPFARLDPRFGASAVRSLRALVEDEGFAGLLFSPSACRIPPYHPDAIRLLEAAASLAVPVLIPSGDAYYSLPEQIALLAEQLSELTLIAGSMGTAFHALRTIDMAEQHTNVYIETSLQQSPARVKHAVERLGAERVLFGSASPYGGLRSELVKIDRANLSRADREAVLGRSADSLLRSLVSGGRTS